MSEDKFIKKKNTPLELYEVKVTSADDRDLERISNELSLGLSLDEMKSVKEYFVNEKRDPTDIELQALGQAWSEHCCYKSSKRILREFVFGIDREDVLSRGDAGVMEFDDEHAYALRLESHNHPSAIEPYGGAATGVGGILRDVMCMGAQPIGLADPLCFGPIDRKGELPPGVKHPRYLLRNAVNGIKDYAGICEIPAVSGCFFFDERYTENCLVNVACFGILKKKNLLNNFAGGPGEIMILIGGKTGRDGIHGVNFASQDLAKSDRETVNVVQGDPVLKKAVMRACLQANEEGLVTGMKDLGGGGLSCVVGEMALAGGCGADVDLEKVHLKEDNMAPWEIWVSESQERMMCTCKQENVKKVLEIFDKWDVTAIPVAKTTDSERMRLFWDGEKIFEMDLEFLTGGPLYDRPYVLPVVSVKEKEVFPKLPDNKEVILKLLSDLNVASREWAMGQYDMEIRNSTAIRPMVGKNGPGDATILVPVKGSVKGLAIAMGCNPWFTSLDPYNGGRSSMDEACRNVVAVGARPNAFTDCLNFGNPEKPERLGEFREAVRGMGEIAKELNIPIPSGNVSLYNEAANGTYILPTPMVSACALIEDAGKAVTADIKRAGSKLFLVGKTKDEMGGSLLFRKFGGEQGAVPGVDVPALKRIMDRLLEAMDKGLVLSCHDCSDGGLAVAVAEMCISGDVGAKIELPTGGLSLERALYSESNTRWIAEVDGKDVKTFLDIMGDDAEDIGSTGGDVLSVGGSKISVDELRKAWNEPIRSIMEETPQ